MNAHGFSTALIKEVCVILQTVHVFDIGTWKTGAAARNEAVSSCYQINCTSINNAVITVFRKYFLITVRPSQ